MESEMQTTSSEKTVRRDTIQDIKEINSQSLSTQANKRRSISFYGACY